MKNKFSAQIEVALKKMCKTININFNSFDFDQKQWYLKHTWTRSQENDYIKWMADRLVKNKKFREGISNYPTLMDKKYSKKIAEMFAFVYGWKIEN